MPIKEDYLVQLGDRKEVIDFIETHHYSHSINGLMSSYCFKLMYKDNLVGAMIYGKLAMANCWKKYVEKSEDLLELRRLVLIDDTPKNTESYFIGATLRWLKKNTQVRKIISYADPNYGHEGIIYKASNFNLLGKTSAGRVIVWQGKKYHDKAIRTKYKGELKPFAKKLKVALEKGEAEYVKQLPKFIYIYEVRI